MHSWSKFFQIRKLLPQKWHARWWHTFIDSVGEALCLGRFCLSLVFRWTWSVIAILETPGYRVRNSETPINPSQYSALSYFFFSLLKWWNDSLNRAPFGLAVWSIGNIISTNYAIASDRITIIAWIFRLETFNPNADVDNHSMFIMRRK